MHSLASSYTFFSLPTNIPSEVLQQQQAVPLCTGLRVAAVRVIQVNHICSVSNYHGNTSADSLYSQPDDQMAAAQLP